MERYVFFDPARIPPGLPVIGIPTPAGLVWVELTASEHEAAVANRLKAVVYAIEAKKAWAVQKQTLADNAADRLTEAQKANEAAAKEAKDAAEDANKAQVGNTVQSLAAEAHDCSALTVLPSACGLSGTPPAA